MPLLKLETNVVVTPTEQQPLLTSLSKIVAETTGKPEQYVMITLGPTCSILMSGKPDDAAFVDIRGIGGLSPDVNRRLSEKVCALLSQCLRIQPNRVYLNFTDIEAANWGWNGETFG
jgi:phenylpyruvate tautomerase PptA (4-oxalocrotonate tautomerase family)